MNSWKTLTFEERGSVGILTINRPEKLNALDATVLSELQSFLKEASRFSLSGLIVTGSGEKAFIAGADIAAMASMSSAEGETFSRLGQNVTVLFELLPYPTLAAVNGFALGGGFEMALACDFIYASEKAVFGLPEVKLGLIPGFGGTQRLARRVGTALALEMVFSGRNVKAQEAKDTGIAVQVFPDQAALMQASLDYMNTVAKNSPAAVKMVKGLVHQSQNVSLEQGLLVESCAFGETFQTPQMKEGTEAFLQKRAANFKGA